MAQYDPRIDAYIEKAGDFARPILTHLRELVHVACPDVEEAWKWSSPHFYYNGGPMCHMAAFTQHCAFGFWKASLMTDEEGVLELAERHAMGHLGRITSLKDLPKDSILKKHIKAAMKINEEGVKTPVRAKATDTDKQALITPPDLAALLKKNAAADKVFKDFAYSKKKEYIDWINDAKTEATRTKRMAEAIDWIAEGKTRHWKYK